MSAAQWRRAMNSGAGRSSTLRTVAIPTEPAARAAEPPRLLPPVVAALRGIRPHHLIVLAALIIYPLVASPFFTFQIGGQALALGLIALSLSFLGGQGGMVSLAQQSVAGVAGYMVAIFGTSIDPISLHWPWWLAVVAALLIATLFATFVGWLSVRTEGIYTIMITLAIGVAFYYLTLQNYSLFAGHRGFNQVHAPTVFDTNLRDAVPFYYLALACAVAGYGFIQYLIRAPFGIALQGVRDNPRRMRALGYNVTGHRVAAYSVAGLLAAVGGVLMVWYNNQISPESTGLGAMIDILVIAVLGGLSRPIGAFLGAIVFVLLQNFAIDLIARERFNLVIGGVFLAIVLFSPDGLLGLWTRFSSRLSTGGAQGKLRRGGAA
ncbi:MAG TPA: branched-chain amino acid ABC transporter permease [Stellaceae bacterium]|nr:branched-chain amino acid ABC transporter permease [Stellaceae bacterium]